MKALRLFALFAAIGLFADFIIFYAAWNKNYGIDFESFDSWSDMFFFLRPCLTNLPIAMFFMALSLRQK